MFSAVALKVVKWVSVASSFAQEYSVRVPWREGSSREGGRIHANVSDLAKASAVSSLQVLEGADSGRFEEDSGGGDAEDHPSDRSVQPSNSGRFEEAAPADVPALLPLFQLYRQLHLPETQAQGMHAVYYPPGAGYGGHCDCQRRPLDLTRNLGWPERHLQSLIYLNGRGDEQADGGGATNFPRVGKRTYPKCGRVLLYLNLEEGEEKRKKKTNNPKKTNNKKSPSSSNNTSAQLGTLTGTTLDPDHHRPDPFNLICKERFFHEGEVAKDTEGPSPEAVGKFTVQRPYSVQGTFLALGAVGLLFQQYVVPCTE